MSKTVTQTEHGVVLNAKGLADIKDYAMRAGLIDSSVVLKLITAIELQHTQIFDYLSTIATLKGRVEQLHFDKISAEVEVQKLKGES